MLQRLIISDRIFRAPLILFHTIRIPKMNQHMLLKGSFHVRACVRVRVWRVPGWDSGCWFFVLLLSFSDLGNVKTLDYLSE